MKICYDIRSFYKRYFCDGCAGWRRYKNTFDHDVFNVLFNLGAGLDSEA